MTRPLISMQFLRFCAVGAVGFVVDAGVLLSLVASHFADPIRGRFVSFVAALCVTFLVNRHWTFHGERGGLIKQVIQYSSVQFVGFIFNISIYSFMYIYMPSPFNAPLFILFVSCASVMCFNFFGSKFLVFRTPRLNDDTASA